MQILLVLGVSLIWYAGTCLRIYRQARYYQIEEYMSLRYIRWSLSERERLLPLRPAGAWAIGSLLGAFTDTIPGETSIMPYMMAILAAILAVIPGSEGEIKRRFVRTQRATRILATSFVLALTGTLLGIALLRGIGIDSDRFHALFAGSIGLGLYLLAPIWLILGNIIMIPVESMLRRRFIKQAEMVLAAVHPKIIGVTGSYGKTTTKIFLRDMLSGRYKTYATPKSYNTLMGICLAINNDMAGDYSIEYFISEMGAYVEGEIERIAELTPPDISVVVEVGPQHLERFGTLEHVATAKYEIIKALKPDGLAVFNWDNEYIREMYERGYPDNRLAVSKDISLDSVPDGGPRFVATEIDESLAGLSFLVTDIVTGQSEQITAPVMGLHNVTNLLLTIAVAIHEGMSMRDVALRARMLQPAESRLVRQQAGAGITIINDAYSANPVGAASALRVLGMHQSGKRLLITPGMVELGRLQDDENHKLGVIAADHATDIILVGKKQTEALKSGILSTQFPPDRLQIVENLSEAVDWYQSNLKAGDTVLFLNDLPDTY